MESGRNGLVDTGVFFILVVRKLSMYLKRCYFGFLM